MLKILDETVRWGMVDWYVCRKALSLPIYISAPRLFLSNFTVRMVNHSQTCQDNRLTNFRQEDFLQVAT